MVDREKEYGQRPNRIIDVYTFLSLENDLKDLDRYVNQIGRRLSDNEKRLQQALPGMIKTFERVEREVRASGKDKLNASQAADLKVMFASKNLILKWLKELSEYNVKTGRARNGRNDYSHIQYGTYLENIMEKLSSSLERSYQHWDACAKVAQKAVAMSTTAQKKIASATAASTQQSSTQSNASSALSNSGINFAYAYISKQKEELTSALTPLLEALERLGKLLNQGKIAPNDARFRAYKVQTQMPSDLTAFTKAQGYSFYGQNAFRGAKPQASFGAARYRAARVFANTARKYQTYYVPPAIPAMPIPTTGAGRYAKYAPFAQKFRNYNPAPFPPKLSKASMALFEFSEMGNIFQSLHKALGTVPLVGKVTGFASGASQSANAMEGVGKELINLFGGEGAMGKIGKALSLSPIGAAIGVAAFTIGAIYKQLKKSSPVLQAVSDIFELAWNLLWMPLGNALGTALLPMAEWLINFAIAFNKLFADFSWENLTGFYYSALQLLWGPLSSLVTSLPMLIINTFLDNAIRLFDTVGLTGAADALRDAKDFMKEIRDKVVNLPTILGDAMADLPDLIKKAFTSEANHIGSTFSEMGDKASKGDVAGMFDTAFRASPGGRLLEKVGILGSGGIVTRPSLNIVGEAGPEAVIPLDKMGGLGSTYVININGDVYGVSDLESRIERVIQRTANKSYYR